jgi:hypothetical protein
MPKRATKPGLTFDDVRRIALALPSVEERTSYGRASLHVGKKMLTCIGRQGDHIVMPMDFGEREMRIAAEPETYFLTDHYRGWPYVLVRLATVRKDAVAGMLQQRWREIAPKRLAAAHAEGAAGATKAAAGTRSAPRSPRPGAPAGSNARRRR